MSSITDMIRRTDMNDHEGLDRLAGAFFRESWGVGPDESHGGRLHQGRNTWDPRAAVWVAASQGCLGSMHVLAEKLYCHGFGETPERRWTYEMIHGAECRCELCTAVVVHAGNVVGFSVGDEISLDGGWAPDFMRGLRIIDIDTAERTIMIPQPPPRHGKTMGNLGLSQLDTQSWSELAAIRRKRRSPRSLRRRR